MNNRYQETTAVIFGEEIIPFWKCMFERTDYGDTFYYQGQSSTHTQPAIWDCKKEKFISFYVVEKIDDPLFSVGDKVVCTDTDKRNEAVITEIEAVVEETGQSLFAKYNEEKSSVRLKGHTIPEHTKVVVYKRKDFYYKVKGVDKNIHPLYLFKFQGGGL